MRLSKSFCPVLRENPQEAEIISHQLMLRAGLVTMMAKGVYSWLPMGVKVLDKIKAVINKHLQESGFQEIIIPVLQPAKLWERSGRYDGYGAEMLRMRDRHDVEFVYGPTAEECATEIFDRAKVKYSSMPCKLYNIQWKFRDEIRPRFGVMRSREFLMKDGYTFDLTEEKALETYKQTFATYIDLFSDLGLQVQPAVADPGVIGGNLSHDFHVKASTGENVLVYDPIWDEIEKPTWEDINKYYSVSQENHTRTDLPMLKEQRSIEVGHNFLLGVKYTESMNVKIQTNEGLINPIMGCYGIGVSRLIGAIIEANHDEKGIIWPKEVAPYQIHIVNLGAKDEQCISACDELYAKLSAKYEVMYDDREAGAGDKFATADLLGAPIQIIIGPREFGNGLVIVKQRVDLEENKIPYEQVIENVELILV